MPTSKLFDVALAQQSAWLDQANGFWRKMFSIPRVAEQARDNQVLQTPHQVVYEEDKLRLLRYDRDTPPAFAEPLLICYALVNRPYILDLQPPRSVIRQFLKKGFDVYLIDWGVATAADRSLTLDDYIRDQFLDVARFVAHRSTTNKFNLLGYCMGGTMSTMFTASFPELVNTLGLMAAPIDFSVGDHLLKTWSKPEYFDVDALVDAFGNCPAPFLQHSFQLMKPAQNYLGKYLSFADKMDDERFVENYFAMEKWTNDNIPVAGETFRQFVKQLYQRNELVKGEFRFRIDEDPLDLRQITCPVLLMVASADHLVPPVQTTGLLPHISSTDTKVMEIDAGHIGLAVSTKSHKTFWPEATAWFADRSTPADAPVEKKPAANARRPRSRPKVARKAK